MPTLKDLKKWSRQKLETELKISGKKGKEGTTRIMKDDNGHRYAIKMFRMTKSPKKILDEAQMQSMAAAAGISPKVHHVDTTKKVIIMDALDHTIVEELKGQRGLPREYAAMLYALCLRLDKAGVVQNDGNPLNLMVDKNKRLWIIDYGFSKIITNAVKKKRGQHPNINLTLWHFAKQLKYYGLKSSELEGIVTAYMRAFKAGSEFKKENQLLRDGKRLLKERTGLVPEQDSSSSDDEEDISSSDDEEEEGPLSANSDFDEKPEEPIAKPKRLGTGQRTKVKQHVYRGMTLKERINARKRINARSDRR